MGNKSVKNKEIEWFTGAGEIVLVGEMEDDHLANTISYIVRRREEYDRAAAKMAERGWPMPPFIINKRSGEEWLDILGKEANRRRSKEVEKAKLILGVQQ